MYCKVTKHEWSDDAECVLVYFGVITKRPNDEREVIGGGFFIFANAKEVSKYSLGKKFYLTENDIINQVN